MVGVFDEMCVIGNCDVFSFKLLKCRYVCAVYVRLCGMFFVLFFVTKSQKSQEFARARILIRNIVNLLPFKVKSPFLCRSGVGENQEY